MKEALNNKWQKLKNKTDDKSREQLKEVENELAERYAKENFEKIKEMVGNQDNEDGGVNTGSLWNLKKQFFPQSRDPPTAMVDPRNGNLLTTDEKIQEAVVYTYAKRLENKPIKENLKHVRIAKEELCEKYLKVA